MNESIIAKGKSHICQKCAKCCKEYWFHTYDYALALRFLYMDTDKIQVERHTVNGNTIYKIRFLFECSHLKQDENGNYYCDIYNYRDLRPEMCRTYPDNLTIEEMRIDAKVCPILHDFLRKMEKEQNE